MLTYKGSSVFNRAGKVTFFSRIAIGHPATDCRSFGYILKKKLKGKFSNSGMKSLSSVVVVLFGLNLMMWRSHHSSHERVHIYLNTSEYPPRILSLLALSHVPLKNQNNADFCPVKYKK